jgi:hypothetical protein
MMLVMTIIGPARAVAGRWLLLEWRTVDHATGATLGHPFGEDASGGLVYTPAGWMHGQLSAQRRPLMPTSDPLGGSESERAAAYSGYVAYWGRYQIDQDRIVHRVESSLFPGWVGGTQIRYFTLADDLLTLRTPPIEVAGDIVVNELRWQRQEPW